MHWLFLAVAILFEVAGTTAMKWSDGLTKLFPTFSMIVCYGISFSSLALALKGMDVSIAYAIWSGLGIVLISIIGMFLFHEPMHVMKATGIAFIVIGVVMLKSF